MLNEPEGEVRDADYRIKLLLCRRTGRWVPPEEHSACPYCFGSTADVARGVHARFCDYDPARDPVQFGFPAEGARESGA